MKKLFLFLLPIALLLGCASDEKPVVDSSDALNDALISFAMNAQATRYSDALEYLTYEDQLHLLDPSGNIKEEYKVAMTRMKLSALQKMPFTLDSKGRLVGMVAVLDEANRRYQISQQQRDMSLDNIEKKRTENKGMPIDTLKGPLPAINQVEPVSSEVPASSDSKAEESTEPEATESQ